MSSIQVSRTHHPSDAFNCPVCLDPSTANDRFCIPEQCCPEKYPTPLFASPNSRLPMKELKQLEECIEEANNLLLVLGSPRDPENTRMLQLHFLSFRDHLVEVKIICGDEIIRKTGQLETAGQNFIQINMIGKTTFILFDRICSVIRNADDKKKHHMQELIAIDGCERREIVLNFGEIVGRKPKLANLFFGIALHQQLRSFIGSEVLVKKEGAEEIIEGILVCSKEGQIEIKKKNELEQINIADICFISIK